MSKQKNLKAVNLFCKLIFVICLCTAFYAYGQNQDKSTESITLDKSNQTIQSPAAAAAEESKDTVKEETKKVPVAESADKVDISDISDRPEFYQIGITITGAPEILFSHFSDAVEIKDKDNADSENKIESGKHREMVVVADVIPNSPAAKSGIKRGDIIVEFGGKKIDSCDTLVEQVNIAKDTEQNVVLVRNGKKNEIKITPEKIVTDGFPLPKAGRPDLNFELSPHQHFKWSDRKQFLQELERMFNQLNDDSKVNLIFSFPESNGELLPKLNLPQLSFPGTGTNKLQNFQGGEAKALSVVTQSDSNGKTKIKVKKSTTINGNTEDKIWEAESIDELPDEIQNEVKQFIGTKKFQ
ncbi:MAG: PDZ domain-containing protein [Planctomycetaceae bacterium]|jgi:membrane-associated protease RseP (regulator of RpoE activity)|nr:PDZ domain-containing protein [Planctomycetaceae bacterium]